MDTNIISSLSLDEKIQAMENRISARAYANSEIEDEKIEKIKSAIDEINTKDDSFYLKLHGPFDDAGLKCGISSNLFSGTFNWFVSISSSEDKLTQEYYGWYVEQLILLATHLGLGTCWVAGTFDKDSLQSLAESGQILSAIVPIGYMQDKIPLKQKVIRKSLVSRNKNPKSIIKSDLDYDDLPVWIKNGLKAVVEGPSAANRQPVTFKYENGVLSSHFDDSMSRYEAIDYGIAKLHFHIACGEMGTWNWGQDSQYHLNEI